MKIVFFVHSIVSDWNNGHAHFLRGLVTALHRRGHQVRCCERWRNWSTDNLYEENGASAIVEFARLFPHIWIELYEGRERIIEEVDRLTRGADVVLVHEFNEPELIGAVGDVRRQRDDFLLLFHDTHHRAASAPHEIAAMNLSNYDGVLAYGEILSCIYRRRFSRKRVFTFHEAADTEIFYPMERERSDQVVWVGNWGDEERSTEIREYFLASARALPRLRFVAHGVRYPPEVLAEFRQAGVEFRKWLPNFQVARVFSESMMTLHIPRRYYRHELPGIPTIRPFEALACSVPLVCTPWEDCERLFRPGEDFLIVETPEEMRRTLARLAQSPEERKTLAASGLETILSRHTCRHRAAELEQICADLGVGRGER